MDIVSVSKMCPSVSLLSNFFKLGNENRLQPIRSHHVSSSEEHRLSRQHFISSAGASLITALTLNCSLALPVWAEDKPNDQAENNDGVVGAIKTLFDPNEKTKSGKVLPKAYLKSAREVVKTLRESLKEDPKDNAKYRRTADGAKESIKEYLSSWTGQQNLIKEESYVVLVKVIRSLASFYSKAGPFAPLPEDVKSKILEILDTAEQFL
ncbi:hypothetical protein ACFE04_005724 [Oxalis oulophora]